MQPGFTRRTRPSLSRQGFASLRGFTLIELMVTIAVVAILLAIAAPSFTSLINNNRLTAQANEVVVSLQQARMEAVRRNRSVTVCRTTDGATCATAGRWNSWITVAAGGEVLRVNTVKAPLQVTSNAASIIFRADGLARAAAGGALTANSITVCIPTTRPVLNRRVVDLVNGSRISTGTPNGAGACP
jgi:type IV fimbrial biogenesis protein FimT